ncbi:leiomodin-2-like [Sipha flava]|uniref:Leiomodin-2-like n=1 Tax=Sipha flava TaxID=143950 RepID=A0A8B8FJS8_9HEMI|nr:leiomodin-2-like [Sipha flava]
MKSQLEEFYSSEISCPDNKTVNHRRSSLKKSFLKLPRWIYGKIKPKKNQTPDEEFKIDGENDLAATTGEVSKKHTPRKNSCGDGDLDTAVVTKLYKANIHMAKELALMKEGQCLFEQKIQAIHDFYSVEITNKDANYNQVVKELKSLKEKVMKITRSGVQFVEPEDDSKMYLVNELDRIQEKNCIMEQKLSEISSFLLQSMNNYKSDYNRFEEQLKTCMQLSVKNSTDKVNSIVDLNDKIEKLQKTVDELLVEKNALVKANSSLSLMAAAEINSLKTKIAMVQRKLRLERRDLKNERTDHYNRKYDKLKMRLCMIEKEMIHRSEQSMQNMVMMSTACLRRGNDQQTSNIVYDTKVQPASFSPRAQETASHSRSPSITPGPPPPPPFTPPSPPPLTPPPPPPPIAKLPQTKQYQQYVINDDLLKDMYKQLRKPGSEIRKIPKRTDMKINCSATTISEQTSTPSEPALPVTQDPQIATNSTRLEPVLSQSTEETLLTPPSPHAPEVPPAFPLSEEIPKLQTTPSSELCELPLSSLFP